MVLSKINIREKEFHNKLHSSGNPRSENKYYKALHNLYADFLIDDAEIIPELLSSASPETAGDLATTLMLNQGFESLTKNSILARFIKQFPNFRFLSANRLRSIRSFLLVDTPKERYRLLPCRYTSKF